MEKYTPPFTLNFKIFNLSQQISERLGLISSYKLLNKMPRLRKQNRIKSIYSSCAIEANSLSINEVKDVINGILVSGPSDEILEVKNAYNAYESINKFDPYNINDLKKAHSILTKDLIDNPGMFRNNEEGVFDGDKCIFIAPPPHLVPDLMNQLFDWMKTAKDEISPLIISCIFHYEFVFIHPFKDGNGRTARLWQNAILGKYNDVFYWLPIESYIQKFQNEYYQAIATSNAQGESTCFIEFMLDMILKTLNDLSNNINSISSKQNIYVAKLLKVMEPGIPMSQTEILKKLNLKDRENLRKNYLKPAMEMGLVEFENEIHITTKNQRYIKK